MFKIYRNVSALEPPTVDRHQAGVYKQGKVDTANADAHKKLSSCNNCWNEFSG